MKEHCTLLPSMLQDKAVLLGGICLCTKDYLGIQRLDLTGHYTKKKDRAFKDSGPSFTQDFV